MYGEFLRTRVAPDRVADIVGKTMVRACAIATADGRFLWANRAFCSMLGYSLDEMIETVRWDRITPDPADLEADRACIRRLQTGGSVDYELVKWYTAKDGDRIRVRLIVTRFPFVGEIDWFFVEAERLGDEHREALQYATGQITRLFEMIDKKHAEALERVDILIAQNSQMQQAVHEAQWIGRACSAFGRWAEARYRDAPIVTAGAVLFVLTLLLGNHALDTAERVVALFGYKFGAGVVSTKTD